jgi:hypothetical protein
VKKSRFAPKTLDCFCVDLYTSKCHSSAGALNREKNKAVGGKAVQGKPNRVAITKDNSQPASQTFISLGRTLSLGPISLTTSNYLQDNN